MNRRTLLQFTGAVLAASAVSTAAAAEHDHHNHGAGHASLVTAAAACVARGEICLDHCLSSLASGDTSLKGCAQSVNEMLAVCGALRSVAAQNARSLGAIARIAHDVCLRCEEECRKHEKKHTQCRDCAEACAACAKECKAVMA
ncbi:MAG: Csp1 family four helix bundle copper storage protein [Burkholderiales bacterium]